MSPVRLAAVLGLLLALVASTLPAEGILGAPGTYMPGVIFSALEKAYPGTVTVLNPLEGPGLLVGGQAFGWAGGRILPAGFRGDPMTFAPQTFYEYPAAEPNVDLWSDQKVADAEARLADRRSVNLNRNPDFYDAVWGIHDRGTADARQKRITFLGLPVTVHEGIVGALQRVETRLLAAKADDPSLSDFLDSLVRLEGYNWRAIAETQSRSNHAYGVAVDLIPKNYGPFNPYWLWVPQDHPGWYRSAWAHRWKPHPKVVEAFEAEGFVWGGKWLLFDTIHFEYRPEILILNGMR